MSALAAARARVVGLLRKESIVAAMPRPEHESVSVLYSVWAGLGQRRIGTRQEIEKMRQNQAPETFLANMQVGFGAVITRMVCSTSACSVCRRWDLESRPRSSCKSCFVSNDGKRLSILSTSNHDLQLHALDSHIHIVSIALQCGSIHEVIFHKLR